MILNSTLLLLIRSLTSALLLLADSRFLILYILGDVGLYLAVKAARRDFLYWIPIGGATGVGFSLAVRVASKLVVDFTGIVQVRASAELGGAYWSLSMFLAIVGSFAAIVVYYDRTAAGDVVMQESSMRLIVGSLSAAWVVCFAVFLLLIKKEFLRTFFSFETGNEWAQKKLLVGKTDLEKADMFTINKRKWERVEDVAKEWIQDNWFRWEEESPAWFTEAWKSNIPDDWLTPEELSRQKLAGGGQRRRSSAFGVVGRMSAPVVPEPAHETVG
jgi:hypothetical protein